MDKFHEISAHTFLQVHFYANGFTNGKLRIC